jgi:hypothetical protein
MATGAPSAGSRRRGPDSTHTDEALLDLVAAVAHAAAADPSERLTVAARVSMAEFNRVKVAVDHARGVTGAADPERTPTANAIHLRFNKDAARKVKW